MQSAFGMFHSKLLELYNKHFPKQRVRYRYNSRKPWLSQGLKDGIKTKNKLYIKYIKIPSVYNEIKYKNYRNKLSSILRNAEKKYYSDLLTENKHNIKKTWQIMKTVINKNRVKHIHAKFRLSDGSITSDKCLISEKFNDFFVGIGPNMAKKIPSQNLSPLKYMGQPLLQSMFLSVVTPDEVHKIINSLKSGAAGYDELSASILKMISSSITSPLAYLCNLSFDQGVFPRELKLANVIPLYKADDPCSFNNYRPVSLLCVLSKVFEKVMYNRLVEYLDMLNILNDKQFGFRRLHSSYMALMALMDKLIDSLEKGEYVVGIFLDFSKVFDTVNHDIMLQKLSHYGIRGTALNWFGSYLSDRKQFVTYNDVSSPTKVISCGVPQGSIPGPLLFLIYINDLCNICKHTTPILFADDTNLFSSGTNLDMMESIINDELSHISEWLKVNKLSLNIKKTQYMIFTKKKRKSSIDLKIDGNDIHEVCKSKFLGVLIDNKLNWKDHISYVSSKISRSLGMIIKARNYLNKDGLVNLYYSFIYPYLTYCNHIWGNTYKTNLQKLVSLQNKVIRIISHAKSRISSQPLYNKLRIMKFHDINKYLIGRFMFKYHTGNIPNIFVTFFQENREIHDHNTRAACHLHIPAVRSDLGKTGIRYRGALIWNHIYADGFNTDVSEAVFVKCLKKIIDNKIIPWISLIPSKSEYSWRCGFALLIYKFIG